MSRRTTLIELLTVAGFCAFLFYFGLSAFGLVGADEPRYAQIAREMLERHDLVTPTLHGKPWLEKPPLYYWRAMEEYRAFGVSDWAARLPSAAAATLMVAVIYFFLRRFRPGTQLNGALMTAASVGMIGFSRGAGTDMLLAAALTVGLLAWFAWYACGRRLWLLLFYFFLALGMLAKGPVAPLLAALIIVVFALVQRETHLIARTLWLPGIILFLAVALPWYVAVQLRNPQFLREFILRHNLGRFTTSMYHHRQPFWYFLPVLLLAVMPWTALVIAGWMETIRGWREQAIPQPVQREGTLPKFLLIWTAVVIVFFSISASKLPGYIMPAVPACTLLSAHWVSRRETLGWSVIVAQGVLSGALLALALLYPTLLLYGHGVPSEWRRLALGAGTLVFVATVSILARRGPAFLRLVVLTPVIVGLAFLLRAGAPPPSHLSDLFWGNGGWLDNVFSARPVARAIAQMEGKPVEVAVFKVSREVEYGLAFYRNQRIPRYERGEIPPQDHLVVVPESDADEFVKAVRPRRASRLGEFAPQRLEFYWVSTPPAMSMEHQH
jgi:4-amino-4-deoxy-L-arabinose transferase-like glycosyltransferase